MVKKEFVKPEDYKEHFKTKEEFAEAKKHEKEWDKDYDSLAKQEFYGAKLENSDLSEKEKGELLETIKYVESEEIRRSYGEKISQNVIDSLSKDITDLKSIEKLSESLKLPPQVVREVFRQQKENIEKLAVQRIRMKKDKKDPQWKKILKKTWRPLAYMGGGIGLSILISPIGAGIAVGASRIIETWLKGRKRKEEVEQAKKDIKKFLNRKSKKARELEKRIQQEILSQLAVAKQEQAEGKEKENTELGKKIMKAEKEYVKGDLSKKEKLEKSYAKQRESYRDSLKKYLTADFVTQEGKLPYAISKEVREEKIKIAISLMKLNQQQRLLELDFERKHSGFLNRITKKLEKIVSLPGNETQKERLTTAGVFAFAGILVRTCPIARDVMLAYAGWKGGEFLGKKIIEKRKGFDILKEISLEQLEASGGTLASVDQKTLYLAKIQLADDRFREKHPTQYARLKELIYAIEKEKIHKAFYSYVEKSNKELQKKVEEKLSKEKQATAIKWAGRIVGGTVGFFAEDIIKAIKELLNKSVVVDPVETVVDPVETVKQGDSVWKIVERQLEKRNAFDKLEGAPEEIRARKDFLIDFYKDKVVENPESFGIDSGNASLIHPGEKINLGSLMEENEIRQGALEAANGLKEEQIKNIIQNREFLHKVLTEYPDKVNNEDLTRAVDIMGGEKQAGPGITRELTQRANEARLNLIQNMDKTRQLQEEISATQAALHNAQENLTNLQGADEIQNAQEKISSLQEELNQNSGLLSAQEQSLKESAEKLDVFSEKSSEEILKDAHESIAKPMIEEEVAPAEIEPAGVAEATSSPEIAKTSLSLETATVDNPISVAGGQIYQENGRIMIKTEGFNYSFFKGADGNYQLKLESSPSYRLAPLSNQADQWLVADHKDALIKMSMEKGRNVDLSIDQLKQDYNIWLRDGNKLLNVLNKADLKEDALIQTVDRSIKVTLRSWINKYGVEDCRKIFQDNVLRKYGFIE